MNGLLAICRKTERTDSELSTLINKGLDTLSHRGADNRNIRLFDAGMKENESAASIALGSCSLLSDGSQSATDDDGDAILFDGRLLNKADLCSRLGLSSATLTDAGVALQVLRRHKAEGFAMLQGYWSLIYLDAGENNIYGARDHFGARTLCYCDTGDTFALATESRTLYKLFDNVRGINRNTVIDFLLWGDIGSIDQYFFNDIHSIEPSYYVKYNVKTGHSSVAKYYTLPYSHENTSFKPSSEHEYLRRTRELITEAVSANLQVIDGPLAVGVSGGMDSSALICTARQIEPQRTIVAYTTTDKYDGGEVGWAEQVVRHTGAEWIKVVCTPEDIIEKLPEANRVHNVPLYNASSLAQFRIMEEIKKQGQTVFIDGQGGDEMLGGYQVYFPLHLQTLRKRFDLVSWWRELSSVTNSGLTVNEIIVRRLKLIGKATYYNPQRLAQSKRSEEYASLTAATRDSYFTQPSPITHLNEVKILNDALSNSYTVFLGNILRWGEYSAASKGLECIMPLSDYLPLAEYVFSIPSVYKIHDGWNKYLLRKSMFGVVPEEICLRKQKMGFYIPEQNWLNEMGDAMLSSITHLEDPEGCVNRKYILDNWKRLYTPQNPLYQRFIFRCYSYLLWVNGL
ncbi:MAG: asparagine synthetase B [Tannerella sp.]|jgi:asparagine synthase (glutamine-hydrolysing)|nr:asparagine synthetase B [Tannerella sp.]